MNFKEKVQAMTARQIIEAMIDGLERPVVEVDMASYGHVDRKTCFGCAATNAVCKIANFTPDVGNIYELGFAIDIENADFVDDFESAINDLRRGYLCGYNYYALNRGFAAIAPPKHNTPLPFLNTENYLENLEPYRQLARAQETK